MHGVVIHVKVDTSREEDVRRSLNDQVVPRAKSMAGFQGGTWLRETAGPRGLAVMLFDSEADAAAAADRIRSEGPPEGAPTTLESIEVFEVAAQA